MDTFGDKLRYERQQIGLSIQAASRILGVDTERLFALERNDFEALPGESVVKRWLRSYARCLGVDAELMIEDYLQERDACLKKLDDAVAEHHAKSRRPSSGRLLTVTAVVVVVALGAWWMVSGSRNVPPTQTPASTVVSPSAATGGAATSPPTATPAAIPAAPEPMQPPTPRVPVQAVASNLGIPVHGVGAGIENRQLIGRSDRFEEGAEVWFLTDVQGGRAGDTVHHVWLRQGVEKWRIALSIGGPRWRTYSSKTLHAGSAGSWAVEARDDAGQVLARQEFACVR